MLKLKNITIKAGDKEIIKDFSYTFEEGKIYAIMGPNGSGKSTLVSTIMGHPAYEVVSGQLLVGTEDREQVSGSRGKGSGADGDSKEVIVLNELSPEERAEAGIFLSFQSPLALSGIRVAQLLQLALKGKKSALAIKKEVEKIAGKLGINSEIINRSLNEGSSGGERKRMEVLQAKVLNKKYQIFDEIDTGVDVDSMKKIAEFMIENRVLNTYILITHYNRILKYLKPDKVLILVEGKLVAEGDHTLAEKIEKEGYGLHRE